MTLPTKEELELCGILESCEDISDDLSFALDSFELVRADLETAIDDLYDELESVKDQIESCTRHYLNCKKKIKLRSLRDAI